MAEISDEALAEDLLLRTKGVYTVDALRKAMKERLRKRD